MAARIKCKKAGAYAPERIVEEEIIVGKLYGYQNEGNVRPGPLVLSGEERHIQQHPEASSLPDVIGVVVHSHD